MRTLPEDPFVPWFPGGRRRDETRPLASSATARERLLERKDAELFSGADESRWLGWLRPDRR